MPLLAFLVEVGATLDPQRVKNHYSQVLPPSILLALGHSATSLFPSWCCFCTGQRHEVEYSANLILWAFPTATTTTGMELSSPPCAFSGPTPSNHQLPHPSCSGPAFAFSSFFLRRGRRQRELARGTRWPEVARGHHQGVTTVYVFVLIPNFEMLV
jgi:hypothetical protein